MKKDLILQSLILSFVFMFSLVSNSFAGFNLNKRRYSSNSSGTRRHITITREEFNNFSLVNRLDFVLLALHNGIIAEEQAIDYIVHTLLPQINAVDEELSRLGYEQQQLNVGQDGLSEIVERLRVLGSLLAVRLNSGTISFTNAYAFALIIFRTNLPGTRGYWVNFNFLRQIIEQYELEEGIWYDLTLNYIEIAISKNYFDANHFNVLFNLIIENALACGSGLKRDLLDRIELLSNRNNNNPLLLQRINNTILDLPYDENDDNDF